MKTIKYLSFVLLALVTASAQARWLSVDPVGFSEGNPASFNRYAYANNNPYKYVDPDGRQAVGAISFSYGLLPHSGMAPQSTVDTMTTGLAVTTGLLAVPVGFGIVFPAAIEVGAAEAIAGATIRGAARQAGKEVAEEIKTRTTRSGEKAIRITRDDGSVIDISPNRVKEYVPNTHPNAPPGTLEKVKFPNAQPGSKGFKRDPTPSELEKLK